MYNWTIDYITLGVYLIAVTVIGTLTARKVTSASTFFMGERKFGKWMMTMFTFGTGTSTDQAVTTVAKTYTVGASGIWYQWLWIFATPVYWLLAPLFRRMRAVTTADNLHARYNQSVAVLFAIVGILGLAGGMLLKRFCTMAWVLTALCGVGMYMNTPIHEDLVWGTMARDLLPGIAPGLIWFFAWIIS